MLVAFFIQKLYSIIMFISHSKSFFTVDKMNFPKFSYCSDNLLHSQVTVWIFQRAFFQGSKKAVWLSGTSTFSLQAGNFSFPLAQWASNCLKLNHSKSEQRLAQDKQTLWAICPKGKLVFIHNFSFQALLQKPVHLILWLLIFLTIFFSFIILHLVLQISWPEIEVHRCCSDNYTDLQQGSDVSSRLTYPFTAYGTIRNFV